MKRDFDRVRNKDTFSHNHHMYAPPRFSNSFFFACATYGKSEMGRGSRNGTWIESAIIACNNNKFNQLLLHPWVTFFYFNFRRHMANSKRDVDRVGYHHAQQEQLLQVPASFCGRYGPCFFWFFPAVILFFFLIYSVKDSCSKYICIYIYIHTWIWACIGA